MFSKIIAIIFEKKLSPRTKNSLIEFAKMNYAEVYVFSVIEKKTIDYIAQQNGRKWEAIQEEQVGKRWFEAYEIEEIFKTKGLFVNLSVIEIDTDDDLMPIIGKIKGNLLILCQPDENEIKKAEKFLYGLELPVLIFP